MHDVVFFCTLQGIVLGLVVLFDFYVLTVLQVVLKGSGASKECRGRL